MREILFRGKTKEGIWVIGQHLVYDPKGYTCLERSAHLIFNDPDVFGCGVCIHGDDVYSNTIGQYVGMTDKRGKKIFEGDIVKDAKGNVGYIVYLQQDAGWAIAWDYHDSRMGHRTRGCNYYTDASLEVIGNIHDNPELIKHS